MRRLLLMSAALALASPALAQDGDESFDITLCNAVMSYIVPLNDQIAESGEPVVVDEVTTLTGIDLDCDAKTMQINHVVDATPANLAPDWRERKQEQWNGFYCDGDVWQHAIEGGWQVIDFVTFSDDTQHLIFAMCD